jgi:hypothetical protein
MQQGTSLFILSFIHLFFNACVYSRWYLFQVLTVSPVDATSHQRKATDMTHSEAGLQLIQEGNVLKFIAVAYLF